MAAGQYLPTITNTAPLTSILRGRNTNIPTNLDVRFEGTNDVADTVMNGNDDDNQRGMRNPCKNTQQPVDIISKLRSTIDKIKQLLDGIHKQIFVLPRQAYKQQVLSNEQSLRLLKAEKRLTMSDKADKVSAALLAEGTASAKTIKVMVQDAVREASEKDKKSKKSTKTKKGEKESKNLRGAQGRGAPAKKMTPKKKNSPSSAKRDGAGGSNNATPADSSRKKGASTKKSAKKKGKPTKQGKAK